MASLLLLSPRDFGPGKGFSGDHKVDVCFLTPTESSWLRVACAALELALPRSLPP